MARLGAFISVLLVLGVGPGHDSVLPAAEPGAISSDRRAKDNAPESLNEDRPQDDAASGDDTGKKSDEAAEPTKPPRIVVVVSKKNPVDSIKARVLERIFLRQNLHWGNGWAITVFERSVGTRIRGDFSQRILGKKPEELNEYWLNLQLTRGLKAPKACRTAKLVKQYLLRTKGGIGYMYEDEVDDTVKVVPIIEDKDG